VLTKNTPAGRGNHSLTLFLKRFAKIFAYCFRIRPAEAAGGVLKQKVDEGTEP
jgi:hypothetical protein